MQSANYGYMLIPFLDIGPELLVYENIPIHETEIYQKGSSLGIYLSLVVGQGRGVGQVGLYGPLPWSELPDSLFLVFAFFIDDPSIKDPRAREEGVMTYAVIVVPKEEEELIHARLALERSLKQAFIKENNKPYVVPNDEPLFLLTSLKLIVWKTIVEGEKLLQEKHLETILDNESVLSLIIVDRENPDNTMNIKGELQLNSDYQSTLKKNETIFSLNVISGKKIGTYFMNDLKKEIIIQISETMEDNKAMSLFDSLIKSMPLLQQYFF